MRKNKLISIRKQKGYTQQQVADFIATDVSNYSRKESGDVRIYAEEWQKIAEYLDVHLDDIFETDDTIIIDKPSKNVKHTNMEAVYLSIIKDLQNYIALLKEENDRLRK